MPVMMAVVDSSVKKPAMNMANFFRFTLANKAHAWL